MILVYLTYLLYKKIFILFVIVALDLIVYLLFGFMQGQKEGMHSVIHVQKLLDQFSCGNDHALKVPPSFLSI